MSDNKQSFKLDAPVEQVKVGYTLPRLAKPLFGGKQGQFVKVRKAGETEKTKLGLYLGDLPLGVRVGTTKEEPGTLHVVPGMTNPAIFVFDDNQIVYGCESWWGKINSPEELKEITDEDIDNVWYVQALKQINERGDKPDGEASSDADFSTLMTGLMEAMAEEFGEADEAETKDPAPAPASAD